MILLINTIVLFACLYGTYTVIENIVFQIKNKIDYNKIQSINNTSFVVCCLWCLFYYLSHYV